MSGYLAVTRVAALLTELAENDPRVVLVTQDLGPVGEFGKRFPERFFDVGISEENLVGVAAGLAHAGLRPFALAMAPFLSMRGFEQIRDDCAYNRKHVVFLAPFAGLEAGPWGATHHALEDIALLRSIPGMTVLSPAGPEQSALAVRSAAGGDGPVYVRLGWMQALDGDDAPFEIGAARTLRRGDDLAILATGGRLGAALEAHDALARRGIAARVLDMASLKPLDCDAVLAAARETGRIVSVEEHSILGGLGGAIAEVLAEAGIGRLARVGVRDVFCTEIAPYEELLRLHGLDAAGIEAAALRLLESAR